ncbi:MAG: acyl carrier protein, partial [Myxococcales bacterium]|nr:acyl carrier protein [Myxococcales bacterium]MDD9970502.1 acyl carrier protein [Myxococcales bacterium]
RLIMLPAHTRSTTIDDISLDDTADLFMLGMTSHASVAVMLALEAEFDVEFPDHLLTRKVFESVQTIAQAVSGMVGRTGAAEGAS